MVSSSSAVRSPMLTRLLLVVVLLVGSLGCGDEFSLFTPTTPTAPTVTTPVISLFAHDSITVRLGQTVTLRWEVEGKDTTVRIDPAPGNVPLVGSAVVAAPSITGTLNYTLTAKNSAGTVQRFVTVTVTF